MYIVLGYNPESYQSAEFFFTLSGWMNIHLNARAVKMTSIDHDPRSTRSPFINRQCLSVGSPVREYR